LRKWRIVHCYLLDHGLRVGELAWANLSRPEFDQNTKLPDESHWTPNTDLRRFVDPEHPEFWKSPLTKEDTSNCS
jgi:hypothetical protein